VKKAKTLRELRGERTMSFKTWTHIIALVVVAALLVSVRLTAQAKQDHHYRHHHYRLVDFGSTFGGLNSYFDPGSGNDFAPFTSVLNHQGVVAGFAETSLADPFAPYCFWNCVATNAFLAHRSGVLTDLGTLPGGVNSAPLWINGEGRIAGVSENGETDPLYPGLGELHAVLWTDGKISDLGTLEGGYESEANAVNRAGQVVGSALNTMPDPNSMQPGTFWLWGGIQPPYLYQTRAFLWDKQRGMQDLGTLPGGTNAQAILINDRGQVIGNSYTSSAPSALCASAGFALTTGSFIWDRQRGMRDLGSLGGTCTLVTDLNERGQVIGVSSPAGDQFQHAFIWQNGSLHDLGGSLGGNNTGAFVMNDYGQAVGFATFPGETTFHATLWRRVGDMTDLGVVGDDECSYATGINTEGQVVGGSITDCSEEFRAFLWEGGSIVDLNTLIPPDSSVYLQRVETINDRGEIAGQGVDGSGNEHAFLLIPCDENHPSLEGCDYSVVDGEIAAVAPVRVASPMPSRHRTLRLPTLLERAMLGEQRHPSTEAAPKSVWDAQSSSSNVAGDIHAAFLRDSLTSPPIHGRGYCLVDGRTDELTGYCHAGTPWFCWSGRSSACPSGAKALKPEKSGCGIINDSLTTDIDRACTF
jgi:probable HAF family extracellular repeat protein